eukprot:1137809-Pelagomonas_calceolata.AAC.5
MYASSAKESQQSAGKAYVSKQQMCYQVSALPFFCTDRQGQAPVQHTFELVQPVYPALLLGSLKATQELVPSATFQAGAQTLCLSCAHGN